MPFFLYNSLPVHIKELFLVKGTTLHSMKRDYESSTTFDHACKCEQLLQAKAVVHRTNYSVWCTIYKKEGVLCTQT